jgi:hypothetical protein
MRVAAGLSVKRFCALAGIPRATWYRRRAAAGHPPRPWPAPVRDRIEQPAAQLALEWPAWGASQDPRAAGARRSPGQPGDRPPCA